MRTPAPALVLLAAASAAGLAIAAPSAAHPAVARPAAVAAMPAPAAAVPARAASAAPAARAAVVRVAATDWIQYHRVASHQGFAPTPAFRGGLHVTHRIRLDGAVYGSPLVVHGMTIVATENDTVYAFNGRAKLVWRHHLATPSPRSQRPCGDINPLGITGTPIFLPSTNLIYVAAEVGGNPPRHRLFALGLARGTVHFVRNVDLPGADSRVMQQRGALAASGGRIWVSYGALAGDCGNYKGRVVGVPARGVGRLIKFDPSPNPKGGIWNPAGPTVSASGNLFLVSANGSTFPGDRYDHTNTVNRINNTGHRIDSFAPTDWAQNNQGDVGLGSNGVALAGPKFAVVGGKSGPVYVLSRTNLGGIGGQVNVRNICKVFGGSAVREMVVYLPCIDGIRAVKIGPRGGMALLWHAAATITGSPVVGGGVVWTMDSGNGVLHALGRPGGHSRGAVNVGMTNRFASPTLSGRRVLIGTLTGLTIARY